MFTAHLWELPSTLIANSFEDFARTRYVPSIRQGLAGADLNAVRLLRRRRIYDTESQDVDRTFLVMFDAESAFPTLPKITDPAVEGIFNAFQLRDQMLGAFDSLTGA